MWGGGEFFILLSMENPAVLVKTSLVVSHVNVIYNEWKGSSNSFVYEILFHRSKYTQRNHFEILLNQTNIRLYLPFSDWFGTKRMSVWFVSNRKMINTIWFRFDLIRFDKIFLCVEGSTTAWLHPSLSERRVISPAPHFHNLDYTLDLEFWVLF